MKSKCIEFCCKLADRHILHQASFLDQRSKKPAYSFQRVELSLTSLKHWPSTAIHPNHMLSCYSEKNNALLRMYSQPIWRKNDLRRNFAVKYPNGDNNKANIRIFLTTVWLDIPISSFLPSNIWTLLLRSWARYARRQTSNYERLQRNSGYDLRHPFDLPLWVQRFPD